ncbi:MAG TPA: hypothetical protein VNS22_21440 [Geminicoccus sp.]|uniref:hypothetical protein n=1 Tax=Geminicoccus sp. TaxID=2024832 RepID=UPI002C66F830|nr:hypothetical protein [Geminicoccus sp.]HWL70919.1 hypothetical protein [Geminicoccus sp.]
MNRARFLHLAWLAVLLAGLPSTSSDGHADRACPCRHAGGMAEQGDIVCLDVNGKRQLARCEMVLNNASWRPLGIDCDVTSGRTAPSATG